MDIIIIICGLSLSSTWFDFEYVSIKNSLFQQWLLILVSFYLLFGEIFQVYDLTVSNKPYLVLRSLFLTALVTLVFFVSIPFVTPSLPNNRLQILYLFLLLFLPVLVWRYLYIWLLFSPKYFKTIIVIAHSSVITPLLNVIKEKNYHNVAAYVSDENQTGFDGFVSDNDVDLQQLVQHFSASEVIVSTDGFSEKSLTHLNKQLIPLFEDGVNIKSVETYCEEVTNRIPRSYLSHNFYKNIHFGHNNENNFYLFAHRLFDVLISIFGLLLFSPLVPFIVLMNLVANRGSLFYSQIRVGKKGNPFRIYKLRTMIANAEANGAVWAQKNDRRITSFGKFLRNTRLDEVPQLFNVLKGDMSFIGPRPERPEFVVELEQNIPFYAIRHVIRPGLTGWAQVNYTYANTLQEQEMKLRYDLYYIKERSLFLDIKILVKTMTTVLFYRGQ